MQLRLAHGRSLDLTRPRIMGVLNVTPDSFSDGGCFSTLDSALQQAALMREHGADLIDVGGESTRPGAQAVPLQDELDRVIPVIEALSSEGHLISIDSYKPQVMQAAIKSGAHMINDVCALQVDGALEVARASGAGVCLMHMQGQPQSMQENPFYTDVTVEVVEFFQQRIECCVQAGIDQSRLIIDPGFGFGKSFTHNCELFKRLEELSSKWPTLVGVSRKRMIAFIGDVEDQDRDPASAFAAQLALQRGAGIIRVHNVKLSRQVMRNLEFLW